MAEFYEMPAISPTMEMGVLVEWKVAEGDTFGSGTVMAEVGTDKANMEAEIFDKGVLIKHLVAEGDEIPPGYPIAIWGKSADEDIAGLLEEFEGIKAKAAAGETADAAPEAAAPDPSPAAPAPKPAARPTEVTAEVKREWMGKETHHLFMDTPGDLGIGRAKGRIAASPLAKRIAADRGLNLERIQGSGPGGRIVKADVENAPVGATAAASRADDVRRNSPMRKTIAKRLLASHTDIPTFFLTTSFDMAGFVDLRTDLKAKLPDVKVSYNDILIAAVARALVEHPEVNSSWAADSITHHGRVDIGVAVAIEGGLITPVVRNADTKSLSQIGGEVRELAGRARDMKLTPEEYTGGTFTISNLGMMEIEHFTAIINPPEAAILAVGAITEEPIIVNGSFEIGFRMKVTMTCDHRVIDGAVGAGFLQTLRKYVESPYLLLVEVLVSDSYDLIVIGAGPGGYPAAIRASQLGLKVACIEREKLGGVCLNWGCIPSKALLKTAELVRKIEHAKDFGLSTGPVEIDYPAVIKRSRKVSKKFEKGVGYLFKKYGVTSLFGTATLLGDGAVKLVSSDGESTLTAKNIVVATGGHAKTFPGIEPDGERVLTYREAIVSDAKPVSVTILGSGAIGIEFAYFWNAMGVEVTVVEGLSEIVPREDAELGTELRKQLTKQGITFQLGQFVKTVENTGSGTKTTLNDGTVLEAELCLVALGVSPNTEGVGLDTVGVTLDRGFVAIDAAGRTNIPGIWAVGDCTTRGGLAHTATAQGHVAAELIAGHDAIPVDYDNIPSCTYCQPGIASVGMTESEATKAGKSFSVGRFPFSANGKAYGAGAPEGFVKVLIDDKYGEILGAHILGAEATEMIAEFVLARSSESPADVLLHTVHAHPTNAEVSYEAVAQALGLSVHI